jgi:hypothetical protein
MKADVVFPISDQFLWLGNGSIDGNSWVFIFTGKGNPSVTSESSTKEPVQSIFWNKSTVVLEDSDVVPALCHWDTLIIGNKAPRHTNEILEQKKAQLEKPDWARILATLGNPNKR